MASKYFSSIQIARALAVVMVIVLHSAGMAADMVGSAPTMPSWANFGFAGVDLFFVVSGFIIALVTSRTDCTASEFAKKRLARIFPFYAFFTILILFLKFIDKQDPPHQQISY